MTTAIMTPSKPTRTRKSKVKPPTATAEATVMSEPTPIILDHTNFDCTRHDGTVTISNPATGQHRTFKIHTVQSGSLQGKRIVSVLVGTDTSERGDWMGFAFVDEFGLRVWHKFRRPTRSEPMTVMEIYGLMVENPRSWTAKGAVYQVAVRCRRCGRELTNPESITSGMGSVCSGRE